MSLTNNPSEGEASIASDDAAALRRSRLAAIVLAATSFMVAIDLMVLLTALPRMAQDFAVPLTLLSATITIYILVTVLVLPISDWVGKRFGTRRVCTLAILGFVLASLGAGLSPNLPVFLAMRMCQAAFGTLIVPVGSIALLSITPKRYLVTAMTISSTPALIAPVIGPPIGGLITTFLDWRWVFFLNVPTGLLAFVLTLRFIPNIHAVERRPFDGRGFALVGGFLACIIAGFERLGAKGGGWQQGLPLIALGIFLGWLCWRHIRRVPHPVVPLDALRHRSFFVSTIGAGMPARTAFMATAFIIPLMMQVGLGLTAFQAGLLLLAQNAGDLALKAIATPSVRWLGIRMALTSGVVTMALSFAACALLTPTMPFWLLVAIMVFVGMARSVHMTAIMALRFADVPQSEVGGATVLGNIANQISQALAISAAAALLNLLSLGVAEPTLADFQIAMLVFAGLALAAAPFYARLAKDTGAAVTGRETRGLRAIRSEEV
ncbi:MULTISPECIES: MFS transporter [unclassified Sphingobium]|uniref:MFS transporter n=1 Tax=unclassified Sphingobium TaxID=2611147 RepID=UPI0022255EF8|nr:MULTISPECIES: MFS transporter [unclassified Sphingobium]MCW2382802.1 MFS family permease [Sphingobium sp. B2D3B]MCW2397025.1 MFS family permease [Sphingobium sp. B2D3C]